MRSTGQKEGNKMIQPIEKVGDRSGLPEHLIRPRPEIWIELREKGRKVAELPLAELDEMSGEELTEWFTLQEDSNRTWKIVLREV